MNHVIHLSRDKQLRRLLQQQKTVRLTRSKNLHLYLCRSIMSQQLSTAVARTIHQRFLDLFSGEPEPGDILATPAHTLRSIGLSNAKAAYVHNVARFSMEQGLEYGQLSRMNNEECIAYLTQIKGVGRWTAEMMLMFALGRKDVIALDDLGIRQAIQKLYKIPDMEKKDLRAAMQKISDPWSPYRTYACIYLWQWNDKAKQQ